MPTIKDVAKMSGVSIATVSNYINGKTVREENKVKIEKAINELEYEVHALARSFRTKKTRSIGVIVNTLVSTFNMVILQSAEKYLREKGYSMIICSSDYDLVEEKERVKVLLDKYVDGIIVFPVSRETNIDDIVKEKVPVVFVDRVTTSPHPAVVVDNVNASYQATEHLIQNMHRQIGLITGHLMLSSSLERLEGYKRAHKDYAISYAEENIKVGDYNRKSGYDLACDLLDKNDPPSAIYVTSHELLLGVVDAANERNIAIPDDLSLITFDHFDYTDSIKPPLTYIKQPYELLGEESAKLVLDLINDEEMNSNNLIRLKAELILRDSVSEKKINNGVKTKQG